MGADLPQQQSGGGKSEKWWKAAFRAGMVLGNRQFPGGIAAWLPTLVLLIGNCKLALRDKARGAEGQGVDLTGAIPRRPQQHRRLDLPELMYDTYLVIFSPP